MEGFRGRPTDDGAQADSLEDRLGRGCTLMG